MRILWLSHFIPYPPKGGALQRSYNLIKELGKYHDITLLAFNQKKQLESSLPNIKDPLSYAQKELLKSVKEIKILDIPEENLVFGRHFIALKALLKGSAYNMEWLKSKTAKNLIKDVIQNNEFDIVHVDTISLAPYISIFHDLPVVLNHHNFESEMLKERAETEKSILKSLYFKYESSRLYREEINFIKNVSVNLACSDEDSKRMERESNCDNFLTVPNGVDTTYFHPNPDYKINEKSILIVGGMSWYPNREAVEYFIDEIWPILKNEFPDFKVNIVGRNPTEKIKKFAEIESNVTVHGFVDDVREYLWSSHFYLCPIKTGGGTKLKILDALATGCCIIADPFSCKGIEVENSKNVLFASSPSDYVNKIKSILENPQLEISLKTNGPKLIESLYSYQSIGRKYSENLKDIA